MKYLKLMLLGSFFVFQHAKAQFETKSAYYPSSNSSYSKIELSSSVDLYSGSLNISIPLGKISMGKAQHIVSIFYNGKGQKVDDYASTTGLGWNLSSGGYVSRTVRGLPDDHADGYSGSNHIGDNIASYNYNTLNKGYLGEWDLEPDLFFVTLPTGSFYFVLSPNGTPLILNNSDFKIVNNPFSNYCQNYDKINGFWIIQDNNGYQYKLGTSMGTEVVQSKLSNQTTSKEYTSTWNLIEIKAPNTIEKLFFEYENVGQVDLVYYNSVKTQMTNLLPTVCSFPTTPNENPENNELKILNKLVIKRIYNDSEQLKFTYLSRLDIVNDKRLSSVELYNSNNQLISKIRLNTDYFTSSGGDKRLRLDGIDQISSDGLAIKVARFNYYQGYSLPNRSSISFDHLGYYNNNTSGTVFYPTAIKEPDLLRTMANSLVSVENQFGGLTRYQYEVNDFYNGSSNVKRGGLRVSEINYEDQGSTKGYEKYIYNDTLTNQSYGKVQQSQVDYENSIHYTLGYGYVSGFPAPCIADVKRTDSKSYISNLDVFNSQVGYSKVIKKNADGSKTSYEFTNYDTYPDSTSVFSQNDLNTVGAAIYTTLLPSTTKINLRGQLLFEKQYNNANLPVAETSFEYKLVKNGEVKALKSIARNIDINQNKKVLVVSSYSFIRQYLRLWKTHRKQIENGLEIINDTENSYANSLHDYPTKIVTSTSDGGVRELQMKYPFEMVSSSSDPTGVYQYMIDQNLTSTAIEKKELIGGTVINLTKTNYYLPHTGVCIPLSLETYNPKTMLNELTSKVLSCDTKGNILSQSTNARDTLSYQWGYNGRYQTASIRNSKISHFYHQNFEGGIVDFDGDIALDNTRAHTGKYSVKINNTATGEKVSHCTTMTPVNLTSSKRFTFSGWVYSDGPSVQLFLFMMRPGETAYYSYYDHMQTTLTNQWVYMRKEFDVPGDVANIFLRLDNNSAGNVWFDDLRIQPAESSMETYTYNPLVGVASQIDDRGNTKYSEYDTFLRIKNLKDSKGNVVKSYTYNYKP